MSRHDAMDCAPKGPHVVSSQPARRVALPSSPAGTLRLCEPYADTEGARCSIKCQMSRSCRPKVRLPQAWERHYVFNDASWYLRPVSNLGAKRRFEIADPTAVALYWKALPVPEARMRACTPDNELMSHLRVGSGPQRRERQFADSLAGPVSRGALAALWACRHSVGLGPHR